VNEVHRLLRAHRSIRHFTDEPVADDVIAAIVRCATAAATSSNLQATTVIRVRNATTREAVAAIAGGQRHIVDCAAFLVFCADLARPAEACRLHGAEPTPGMTEQFIIATVDVALAAQNAAIAAESLGLGICYIGAIRNDPQPVAELLDLPLHVYPVFGMCIGHPAQDPEVKPRLPVEVVLHEERYRPGGDREAIDRYDERMRTYYRSRSGGNKDSCWTAEMAGLVGTERRPHMRRFLAERGFELR
jgi:nitroreductase